MKSKSIIRSVLIAELLLLVPLVAMQFTTEVNWGVSDFIVVGVLLAGIGVAYQLIATGLRGNSRQAAFGILLAAVILLIWIELAVGIFGTPFAGS